MKGIAVISLLLALSRVLGDPPASPPLHVAAAENPSSPHPIGEKPQGVLVERVWVDAGEEAWHSVTDAGRLRIRLPPPEGEGWLPLVSFGADMSRECSEWEDRGKGGVEVRILLDGARVASCKGCGACSGRAEVGQGKHMVLAEARGGGGALGSSHLLLEVKTEGAGDAPSLSQRAAAARLLGEYTGLHRRILAGEEEGGFLVVRSAHGISNTQIEEVTALLVAVETGRALILDFSNDSYTGPRPALEYEWPFEVWVDGMLPFLPDPHDTPIGTDWTYGRGVEQLPRTPGEEYAKYAEFLACQDWRSTTHGKAVIAHTLFGFPAAFLNRHMSGKGSLLSEFGHHLFPLLHEYLHKPSPSVVARTKPISPSIKNATCSVGMQIRWHHLRAYYSPMGGERTDGSWGIEHQAHAVGKFVRCAASLCPLSGKTVFYVATDFFAIVEVVREELRRIFVQQARDLRDGELPTVLSLGGEGGQDGDHVYMDNGDHESARADQLLLGECDHIVTTRESTMGYVAHASVSKPYWQVSPYESECVAVSSSQSGLFLDSSTIHDEWPWSEKKFRQLSCWDEAEGRVDERSSDVLLSV